MPKATSPHICQSCGFSSPKWHGRCPRCEQWDTMEETAIARPVAAAPRSASALSRGRRPALVQGVPLSVAPLQRKRESR